ncbi:MAG: putative cAMP-binding protein-catabolite activator and regulatory subunit of cAMP-dependent [Chloroflexi bacterium]|jgi:CRP-like cAMP-binding protein|nr:putative cAMP-binding protein-catabolite activator and regulatory subunit of cAMP-dependent [Chloroflexota bacterium]
MTEPHKSVVNIQAFISSLPLFVGSRPESLAALAAASRIRKIPKGQVVFFQSDQGDAIYAVRSGSVAIQLVNTDGREMIINQVGPGEVFGELAVLTGRPRSTNVVAMKPTELVMISGEVFTRVVDSDMVITRHLLDLLAHRLSASTVRESSLAFLDGQARLALTLLNLDEQWQEEGLISASQAELAVRTGLTRQTVAKILGRWRRAGWLLTGRGRIMLLDREALKRTSQEGTL